MGLASGRRLTSRSKRTAERRPAAAMVYLGVSSILPFGLEAEHVLPEHAAGGIPIEADVGGGGVRVAPAPLQRMVQEQALAAGGQEQRIDGLHEEPHAKRLVAAVAQPHVHADRLRRARRSRTPPPDRET